MGGIAAIGRDTLPMAKNIEPCSLIGLFYRFFIIIQRAAGNIFRSGAI
jgi:hypothetical protein